MAKKWQKRLESMKRDDASKVIQQYKDGLAYKKRMGFLTKWPEYERFKSGDQWPSPTERTKNLPRPVFNIIELIEAHKVSSVMNEQIKMVYSTIEDDQQLSQSADILSRYSETLWENIKQDQLNEEALEDAANRGTGIWHYYWDSTVKIGNQKGNGLVAQGEIAGEIIDPVNIFFGNPQQRRVQKQPYIIITSRELVEGIRSEAIANGVSKEIASMIKGDKETTDQAYDMAQVELNDSDKVTVLTKYWKDQGTVFFMKVASGITVKPKTPTMLSLYPIATMPWKRRKKSIFGVGETEGLIPNQKTINFLMAMQTLSVQLTGWPKLVYNPNFIDPSKITNTPGEMIADSSPPGTKSVDYMNTARMTDTAPMLVEKFIDYTKEMTGANDASTGEAPSSDLNATAIMLLQKASGVPIESIKRRFYQAMEDVGRIWEEFIKVKYNTERMIRVKDDQGNDETVPFTGINHADVNMNLKIDIGPSSSYSESLMMASLDRFLDQKYITFDQYLRYAPKNVVPFRDRLLKEVEKQQAEQAQMQVQQIAEQIHQQQLMAQQQDPSIQFIKRLPQDVQQHLLSLPSDQQGEALHNLMNPQPTPKR